MTSGKQGSAPASSTHTLGKEMIYVHRVYSAKPSVTSPKEAGRRLEVWVGTGSFLEIKLFRSLNSFLLINKYLLPSR